MFGFMELVIEGVRGQPPSCDELHRVARHAPQGAHACKGRGTGFSGKPPQKSPESCMPVLFALMAE